MAHAPIPLVDLRAQYLSIQEDIDAAIRAVIDSSAYIGGYPVEQFSRDFADLIGVDKCVPVANGTDAIYISLKMLGIGPGDEVVTVANSWISTSEAISQTGATPVFVDIDEYFHIDVHAVEATIGPNTKALLPVHIFGQPANMDAILEIGAKHNVAVLEDCAQAHLAEHRGRAVGTMGQVGTFSFYPGKNLGAYGDAGAIVTNDASLADACRMYANHGALTKHDHQIEGVNSRLDGMQAAILSAKMPYLKDWTAKRQRIASHYDQCLEEISEVVTPLRRPGTSHSFHLYVIRATQRDELALYLKNEGIGCAIHYPTPLPLLPAYGRFTYSAEKFPKAVRASEEILSLPIFPELNLVEVERVCDAIRDFYSGRAHSSR